jgi:hypothetical protein
MKAAFTRHCEAEGRGNPLIEESDTSLRFILHVIARSPQATKQSL